MSLDFYGVLAALFFGGISLFSSIFNLRRLKASHEKKTREENLPRGPMPNENLIKFALFSGVPIFLYVGYNYLGPILKDIVGAN